MIHKNNLFQKCSDEWLIHNVIQKIRDDEYKTRSVVLVRYWLAAKVGIPVSEAHEFTGNILFFKTSNFKQYKSYKNAKSWLILILTQFDINEAEYYLDKYHEKRRGFIESKPDSFWDEKNVISFLCG